MKKGSEKNNATAFTNRLLAFRKKLGMTQRQFADHIGMPYRTYQDIELGVSKGTKFTVQSLTSRMDSEANPKPKTERTQENEHQRNT